MPTDLNSNHVAVQPTLTPESAAPHSTLYPVVLMGGSGTRLWPVSRNAVPKQLLPLTSSYSMLQETLLRLRDFADLGDPLIVANHEHRFLVAEQLRQINATPQALVLEPFGRNTAPAVAVAALHLQRTAPDAVMLIMPADHVIADVPAFHRAIEAANQVAKQGYLATFGVIPDKPETGYGYIERGDVLGGAENAVENEASVYHIARFVEKPNPATAQEYVESGNFYWNSGMFLFGVSDILRELETYAPDVLAACRRAVEGAYADLDFLRLDEESFKLCPSDQVDVAVMEKTARGVVVPVDIGWNDVGSWSALWDFHEKDADGNVTRGDTYVYDAHNNYVHSERRLVTAVGVDNLVIVETPDAVLVTHKDKAQDVKRVVEKLHSDGRIEGSEHRRAYRPWGSYESIDTGARFQVKRLTVNPGAVLSLQMHHHRSEHWVVVSGTAEVTLDTEKRIVTENESIYIPLGALHRIHNPGRIPLHIVEVQSGPYLGEDDIVRFEDTYGRTK